MNIIEYRNKVDELLLQHRMAEQQAKSEQQSLFLIMKRIEDITEAQQVAQQIAQTLQQTAHDKIARIVTRCLNVVFDDPYEFRIRFDRKRGKTEARMVFVRDGLELDDPLNEVGGGVVDVASLALRLACIMLSRPKVRRLLILDEPFKNIRGEANKARTRLMLSKLAEDLGIQFVLNTDIKEYRMGTVVELPQ